MKKNDQVKPVPARQTDFHQVGQETVRSTGSSGFSGAYGSVGQVGLKVDQGRRNRAGSRRCRKQLSSCPTDFSGRKQQEKKRLLLKPGQVLLWSFLLPILILTTSYLLVGIFPFWGEKTSLTIDLYHQYAPFLAHLRDKLVSGGSLFYDWNIGLGTNFLALSAYYLGSPLNLFLLLFPPQLTSDAVILLTLAKVGLAGLSFCYFLREAYCFWGANSVAAVPQTEVVAPRQTGTHFALVLGGAFYALSGFVVTFSWNIMWLDGVVLLPLIMLGMHRLIREGKFLLYTLSFSAAFLINYYIALFISIFTVAYYFVVYVSFKSYLPAAKVRPVRHFWVRAGQMLGFTTLALAISAIVTLPTYLALRSTSAVSDQFPEVWSIRFSLFEFMGRHMVGVAPSIREGLPNIYSGVLTFTLIPLYVLARHIRLPEKLMHLGLLVFLFFSFNINGLDFIWHGLHYPNQLPYRYSFVYSFLLLVMGFRLLMGVRQLRAREVVAAISIGITYVVLAEVIIPDSVDHATVYLTLTVLVLYLLFFLSFNRGQESLHRTAALVAIICVAELCINSFISLSMIDEKEYFTRRQDFNNDVRELRTAVSDLEERDPDFWRLEMLQQKTTNSPALYNYRGFTIFSSTSPEKTARLMKQLGFHGNNINSYKYTASTAPLNAFFNIRYLLNKEESMVDPLLTEVARAGDRGYIYEQEGVLPPGFGVPAELAGWQEAGPNPFKNQNSLFRAAGAARDLLEPLDLTFADPVGAGDGIGTAEGGYNVDRLAGETEMSFTARLTVPTNQHVYFHFSPNKAADFELTCHSSKEGRRSAQPVEPGSVEAFKGEETGQQITTVNMHDGEMVDAGFHQAGDVILIKVTAKADGADQVRLAAAGLNLQAYREAVAEWGSQGLKIENFKDNSLSGSFNMMQPGYLFLSIPYDPAWRIKVDGVGVTALPLAGGLSLVPAAVGAHRLEMTFIPPGFYIGAAVTGGSLLLLILLAALRKAGKAKKRPVLIGGLDLSMFAGDLDAPGQSEGSLGISETMTSDLPPDLAAGFTEVSPPSAQAEEVASIRELSPELFNWGREAGGPSGPTDTEATLGADRKNFRPKSRPAWERALTERGPAEAGERAVDERKADTAVDDSENRDGGRPN